MIVNSLNIVFEAGDLQRVVSKLAGEVDKLKELTVSLEPGTMLLSGKVSVGLSIPFVTKWQARVRDEGRAAGLTLTGCSVAMMGMGEEMISTQVLSLLSKKLEGHDSVRIEGKEIIVDLHPALSQRGITLNAPLTKLEISPSGILLEA